MIRLGDFKATERQKKIVNEILDSGNLTEGKYVDLLEREMEKYLGVKHAILVSSGTTGLQLISHYLGVNQLICVPSLTFPATINAFALTGTRFAFCDVGDDLQINIDTLTDEEKRKITVMVPVHLMGYPANMDKIMEEAKKYNWVVIEDACEAFGGEYKGKKVGTIGDFGVYSFYMSHNLSTGELGLVVTNNSDTAEILRSLKNHGRVGDPMKFNHRYVGSNYKTTEFMAGICYDNMSHVTSILKTRFDNAKYLFDNITNSNLKPFPCPEGFSPLGYPIRAISEEYRNKMCQALNAADIETRYIFPCLSNQKAYWFVKTEYPVANELEKTCFYIGVHHFLKKTDLKKMVGVLNNVDI